MLCAGSGWHVQRNASELLKSEEDKGMDAEQIIADIELLERLYAEPDIRPLTANDVSAANRRHDEKLANSPWFRLWQSYGICCRGQSNRSEVTEFGS